MTLTLRAAHLAVAGAFLAGVGLVVIVALAAGSGEDPPPVLQAPTATVAAAGASPRPEPSATPVPTGQPAPLPATPSPAPPSTPAADTASPTQGPLPAATRQPAAPGAGYEFIGAVWGDEAIPVPYCVNPANPPVDSNGAPLMAAEEFAAAVRSAFQAWEDVPGSYVAFAYTGTCDNDPFETRDQVNAVGWGWLFSTAVGIAAPSATHGQFLRQSSFGQIFELDIAVDVRYAQSFDDESEYINRVLPWILLHEIGHFIGLDHTEEPCSIMQAVVVEATPALCEADHNGARALYPG